MIITFGQVKAASTGLFAASVEGGTLKVIEGYAPFESLDWTETAMPLTAPSSAPVPIVRVRTVSFDLLVLSFDLPQRYGYGVIAALEPSELESAIDRIRDRAT